MRKRNYAKWMTHESSCSGVSRLLDNDSPRLKSDPVTAPFFYSTYIYTFIHPLQCTRHSLSSCDASRRFLGGKFPRRSAVHARFLEMTRAKDEWARWRRPTKGKSTGGRGIVSNWIISNAKTCRVSHSSGNDDPVVLRCTAILSPLLPVPRRSRPPVFPFAIIRSQYSRDRSRAANISASKSIFVDFLKIRFN